MKHLKMKHLKMKRKSISKIVRLLLDNVISMDQARFMAGLKESQLKQLVDARIVNNSHKPSISIYQCLVSERPSNIDLSKTTRDRYNRLCLPIFGRPTPIFNY